MVPFWIWLDSKNYSNPHWAIFNRTCVIITVAATILPLLLFIDRVLSRCYPHFMDPRGSVLCSQDSTNKFYSEFHEFIPHLISLTLILVLSSYLWLILQNGLFLKIFSIKVYAFLIFVRHPTCSAHLILLDLATGIIYGEGYTIWRSLLCNFLHFKLSSTFWVHVFSSVLCTFSILDHHHHHHQCPTSHASQSCTAHALWPHCSGTEVQRRKCSNCFHLKTTGWVFKF